MDAKEAIGMVRMVRGLHLGALKDLSAEQWTTVPEGFGNNVLWNAGHIAYYTGVFMYGPCGKPVPLPEVYKGWFKEGSSPKDWSDAPDAKDVLGRLGSQMDEIEKELGAGAFEGHQGMELFGNKLDSIPKVLTFHCTHEGIHLGRIMSLLKLI